jgi:hypothetical protein
MIAAAIVAMFLRIGNLLGLWQQLWLPLRLLDVPEGKPLYFNMIRILRRCNEQTIVAHKVSSARLRQKAINNLWVRRSRNISHFYWNERQSHLCSATSRRFSTAEQGRKSTNLSE